jgi:hypothetical protein
MSHDFWLGLFEGVGWTCVFWLVVINIDLWRTTKLLNELNARLEKLDEKSDNARN